MASLETNVIDFLGDVKNTAYDLEFKFHHWYINTASYEEVARHFIDDIISLTPVKQIAGGKAPAAYNSQHNVMFITPAVANSKGILLPEGKRYVLHEATHAYLDIISDHVLYIYNEIVAYIAEGMYAQLTGAQLGAGAIRQAASKIVNALQRQSRGKRELTLDGPGVSALWNAIFHSPTYNPKRNMWLPKHFVELNP